MYYAENSYIENLNEWGGIVQHPLDSERVAGVAIFEQS